MDNKTMAQAPAQVGRTVPTTTKSDTPAVPGDYHDYMGSQNKSTANPYDSRSNAIASALGLKDSDKG